MITVKPNYIATRSLLLKEVTPAVLSDVYTFGTDEEIMHFMGIETREALEAEKKKFAIGWTTWNKTFHYYLLSESASDKVIGWCGYHTWYVPHLKAELGYGLYSEAVKGRGYMSEALVPILKYGFEEMKLNRIEAYVGPDNIPSNRLMEKNGFTREGLLREHYMNNGNVHDSIAYSILRKEYLGISGMQS